MTDCSYCTPYNAGYDDGYNEGMKDTDGEVPKVCGNCLLWSGHDCFYYPATEAHCSCPNWEAWELKTNEVVNENFLP